MCLKILTLTLSASQVFIFICLCLAHKQVSFATEMMEMGSTIYSDQPFMLIKALFTKYVLCTNIHSFEVSSAVNASLQRSDLRQRDCLLRYG